MHPEISVIDEVAWVPGKDEGIRVEQGYPPNYVEIVAALGEPAPNVCFAWGDRVYFPGGTKLAPEIEIHESVHFQQQAEIGGPELWWAKYLSNAAFRLEQEVEAMRAQIACQPTREYRRACRRMCAKQLAGPTYQLPITWQQADAFLQGRAGGMATSLKARPS